MSDDGDEGKMSGAAPGDELSRYDADLADRLTESGYLGLFQQSDESALEYIWNASGAPEALQALALHPDAPVSARFLAAELLFHKRGSFPPDARKDQLAPVYATALAQNFTETANPWGLPGVLGGNTGEHLVALGHAMVPELINLLDDEKRVYYEGSQEATLAHHYGYRVKDLAASFVGRIRGVAVEMSEDPGERDAAIAALQTDLAQASKG